MNNTKVYNAKDLDAVMPMYNFIEYSDNYSILVHGNNTEMR